MVKCNFSFIFNRLSRGAIGYFHIVSYFSIQVNIKLKNRVQSVTKFITYGTKRSFKKFMIQSIR